MRRNRFSLQAAAGVGVAVLSLCLALWCSPAFCIRPQAEGMMRDVETLSRAIGPRPAGSQAERRAAAFIASRFRELGYPVRLQEFALPNGLRSANVIAGRDGPAHRLLIGGHYDSRPRAPGANDNASGLAVILEVAKALRPVRDDILFVAFGSEERIDQHRDHHHYGSRHFVRAADSGWLAALGGMLCVDCVGTGTEFRIQGMRSDAGRLAHLCRLAAREQGIAASGGWASPVSDHAPFGRAGVPVAAFYRTPHPLTHTPGDTILAVRADHLQQAATAVLLAVDRAGNAR